MQGLRTQAELLAWRPRRCNPPLSTRRQPTAIKRPAWTRRCARTAPKALCDRVQQSPGSRRMAATSTDRAPRLTTLSCLMQNLSAGAQSHRFQDRKRQSQANRLACNHTCCACASLPGPQLQAAHRHPAGQDSLPGADISKAQAPALPWRSCQRLNIPLPPRTLQRGQARHGTAGRGRAVAAQSSKLALSNALPPNCPSRSARAAPAVPADPQGCSPHTLAQRPAACKHAHNPLRTIQHTLREKCAPSYMSRRREREFRSTRGIALQPPPSKCTQAILAT